MKSPQPAEFGFTPVAQHFSFAFSQSSLLHQPTLLLFAIIFHSRTEDITNPKQRCPLPAALTHSRLCAFPGIVCAPGSTSKRPRRSSLTPTADSTRRSSRPYPSSYRSSKSRTSARRIMLANFSVFAPLFFHRDVLMLMILGGQSVHTQVRHQSPPRFTDLEPVKVPIRGAIQPMQRCVCTLASCPGEFPRINYGLSPGQAAPLFPNKKVRGHIPRRCRQVLTRKSSIRKRNSFPQSRRSSTF